MKLERVILENFRQYFGVQRLEFARGTDQNVTIIHGINGAGKTSFFLALNWCLYGRRAHDVQIIDNVGELMSKEAIAQANPGVEVITSVQLTFTHNGNRYRVRRTMRGQKQPDGMVLVGGGDDFVIMTSSPGSPEAQQVGNPIGVVNSILPPNVREYFLFDGEKIDNFAKPQAAEQVKQAVYLVLNIEILERGQRHLARQASEYRRQLGQLSSGELRNLVEQEEHARIKRSKAEKRREELKNEVSSANTKIAEIDERLRNIQDAQALQQRRDRLQRDIDQRGAELNDAVSRLATTVTSAHVIFARPAIEQALTILEDKRQRGEIPSGIRQQFVQDLLDRKICICGRPVSEHSPEHQHLLTLLDERLPGSIEDDVLETNALLRTFVGVAADRRAEINAAMQRRTELAEIISHLEQELDDVSRQLEGSPLEEISQLEARRQEYRADIDRYYGEIGSLGNQVDTLTEDIKRLEREIKAAKKEEQQQALLATKLELAQESSDAIAYIYATFADDMRQRIETKVKEIFRLLIWKDSHFMDVHLDKDFNLEVIDRYGQPARPELSAGERQVLSLSFIAAMAQISEEEAPLVMDTPFGRLSSHHRNSITEHLPKLAHQLILFVTDEELRDQALENLKPHIGAEYRLSFDRITSCTQIEQVE